MKNQQTPLPVGEKRPLCVHCSVKEMISVDSQTKLSVVVADSMRDAEQKLEADVPSEE